MPVGGAQQSAPPPPEPPPAPAPNGGPAPAARAPLDGPPPAHSPPARRGHRYREDGEPGVAPAPMSLSVAARPRPDAAGPPVVGPGLAETPPDLGVGRRAARRRAEELAAAQATSAAAPIPPVQRAESQREPAKADQPVAQQAPRLVSRRGWRRWVHALTRINFGLSPDEKRELELRSRIRRNPRGSYEIGVLGLKGGAGKTTLTVALGSTFAEVRGDRILALDADPGAGNLAARAGLRPSATIASLLADNDLSAYNNVRAHTSTNAVHLEVLPAEEYSAARRGLSGEDWHLASSTVSRFYNLVLADCGAGFFDPVTQGVLSTASAVVIVASASVDGAQQALVALDWLRNNGYQDLLRRACLVINHVVPGEPNIPVRELLREFGRQVQPGRIVVLPWDKHIASGTEIQLASLDSAYKRRVLELAAALSEDFERAGRR